MQNADKTDLLIDYVKSQLPFSDQTDPQKKNKSMYKYSQKACIYRRASALLSNVERSQVSTRMAVWCTISSP